MAKSADYDRPKLTTTERNDPEVRKAARKVTTGKRMMATAKRTSYKQPLPSRGGGKFRDGTSGRQLSREIDAAEDDLRKKKLKANLRDTPRRAAKRKKVGPAGPQGRK